MKKIIGLFWNPAENRLRSGLRISIVLVLFIVIYKLYISLLNSLGVSLMYSSQTPLRTIFLASTVRIIPLVILVLLSSRFLEKRKTGIYGLSFTGKWLADFGFGFFLGAFLISLVFVISLITGSIQINAASMDQAMHNGLIIPLLVFLFFFACQAAFEEILLRSYFLKNLSEGLNFGPSGERRAVLLSWILISVVFGLSHLGNDDTGILGIINLILAGFTFGYAMIVTGSLAIPIGLHIAWNFFQASVYGFPVSGVKWPAANFSLLDIESAGNNILTGGEFGPEGGLLGILVNITGILLIALWIKYVRKKQTNEINIGLASASYRNN